MKPFLLLQTRPEDAASDNEYEGFLLATGLSPEQLRRIRVEAAPLPHLALDDYSGIILGGSPYSVSTPRAKKTPNQQRVEKDLFALLDRLVESDYPFFGACYGVGILGKHQGAVIGGKYGESVGAVEITPTPEGRQDPLFKGVPERFQAIVGHKESCEVLPSGAVLLASSPACPVQMFRIKDNIYATQFHPELDMAGLQVRVEVYRHAGYFPPDDAQKILSAAAPADLTHAPLVLRNFVKRYAR